jgi:small-conductance mechanosensitive channel
MEFIRDGFVFLRPYPYVQAALVITSFLILAKVADWLCTRVVRRIVSSTKNHFDDQLIDILHRPVFLTIATIGLVMATFRLKLEAGVEDNTIDTLKTILIIVWVLFGLRFSKILFNALGRSPARKSLVQPATRPLFTNALAVFVVIAGAYAILESWEINVTGLVASAGIIGLALSFAAQDTLANLVSGIAIIVDRPYQIGDYIILDSGERGQVTEIGLRSTRLLTRDDVEVTIPNGVMGQAKIVNEAGGPRSRYRVRLPVGVAYGSDIDQVMDTLLEVCNAHEKVSSFPDARVRFRAFGDSSLDFELLCWIAEPADRGLVTHELNCSIYKAFAERDIQIPFPQRDLHIKEMPGSGASA